MNTQQVGKAGELLFQYKLLKADIDSSTMTTDYGIDLLALNASSGKVFSIQVKSSMHHRDESSDWVEWNLAKDCPAEYIATVDCERDRAWVFNTSAFAKFASSTGSGHRLWWYLPGSRYQGSAENKREEFFSGNEASIAIPALFKPKQGAARS